MKSEEIAVRQGVQFVRVALICPVDGGSGWRVSRTINSRASVSLPPSSSSSCSRG